jgi:hypothetical protein
MAKKFKVSPRAWIAFWFGWLAQDTLPEKKRQGDPQYRTAMDTET